MSVEINREGCINTMSLKSALIQYKQSKAEEEITRKIEQMIAQQKAILDTSLETSFDVNKDGDIVRVSKTWNPSILTDGGVSYYKFNDKKYRISVTGVDNDIILKFKCKNALGEWFSVSAKTYKEAQDVVDNIYGHGKYKLSANKI